MAEAYGEAEIANLNAKARVTSEEAAAIAAKRELTEAEAGTHRQLEVKEFIANVEAIEKLESEYGRKIAFAKLIEQNPDVMEQVELIESMVDGLRYKRNLSLTRVSQGSETEEPDPRQEIAD